MHNPNETPQPSAQTAGIQFLDNELDLCHTFLDLAEIDAEDPADSAKAEANARKGYQTVLALIETVRDPAERHRLAAKLELLKQRIDRSQS